MKYLGENFFEKKFSEAAQQTRPNTLSKSFHLEKKKRLCRIYKKTAQSLFYLISSQVKPSAVTAAMIASMPTLSG